MTTTISNRADAAQMQIAIMQWEAFDAFCTTHLQVSANLTQADINLELESIQDLAERNPKHLSRAWDYLQRQIESATSKRQILLAFVAGEADNKRDAIRIYDEAMATQMSVATMRKLVREANGKPSAPKESLVGQGADLVEKWRGKLGRFVAWSAADCTDDLAALPAIARELKKRAEVK